MKPNRVEVINTTLAIAWEDGQESYLELETLRRACPCALCKGETNILVATKPQPGNYTPASFELRGWQFVGGYGLQPHWADGHAAGIYSFDYLRQLTASS
jgi:DUF971 family protein